MFYSKTHSFLVLCVEINTPTRSLFKSINEYIIPKHGLKDLRDDLKDENPSAILVFKIYYTFANTAVYYMIYVRSSTEVKYTIFLSKDIEKFGFSVALAVAYVLPNLDWIASRDLSIFSVQAA